MARFGFLGMATIDTLLVGGTMSHDSDAVNILSEAIVTAGGKGLVAAAAAVAAGGEVSLLSLVGKNSQIFDLLPKGVSADNLFPVLSEDHRIWLTIDQGLQTVTYVMLGTVDSTRIEGIMKNIEESIKEFDGLYITIEDLSIISHILTRNLPPQLTVCTNLCSPLLSFLSSTPEILGKLVDVSHILIMNDNESYAALRILGYPTWADVPVSNLGEIVITDGARGGRAASTPFHDWTLYESAGVDGARCPVGAGDTFAGAYLVARLVQKLSIGDSCALAADMAGRKVSVVASSLGSSHR